MKDMKGMKGFLFFLHGLHVLHGVCLSVASRCGVWKGLGWGVKCVRREGKSTMKDMKGMKGFLFFLHGLHALHGVCLSVASRCGVWKRVGV